MGAIEFGRARSLRYGVAAAAVVGAGTMVACSLLVTAGNLQCASNDDCHARGPAFASAQCVENACQAPSGDSSDAGAASNDPWACLNQPSLPGTQPNVDIQILLYDTLKPSHFGSSVDGGTDLTVNQYTAQAGIQVRACGSLDLGCSSPESMATTDEAGIASVLGLPGSFIGFYALTRDDSIPAIFYPGMHLLQTDTAPVYATAMTQRSSIASLGAAYGIDPNQDAGGGPGLLSVTQFDCNDRHVSGVSFAITPVAEKVLYLQNAFPSSTATQTSVEASAIMVNVPSGSVQVISTLVATNKVLQTQNVVVQPGTLTLAYLRPRAR